MFDSNIKKGLKNVKVVLLHALLSEICISKIPKNK